MNVTGGAVPPPPPSNPRKDPYPLVIALAVIAAALTGVAYGAVNPDVACRCPTVNGAWIQATPATTTHTPSGYVTAFTITKVVNPPEV